MPTDPNMFQTIGRTPSNMSKLQKMMLTIIFFNFLDVLNYIYCLLSGTFDEF